MKFAVFTLAAALLAGAGLFAQEPTASDAQAPSVRK